MSFTIAQSSPRQQLGRGSLRLIDLITAYQQTFIENG